MSVIRVGVGDGKRDALGPIEELKNAHRETWAGPAAIADTLPSIKKIDRLLKVGDGNAAGNLVFVETANLKQPHPQTIVVPFSTVARFNLIKAGIKSLMQVVEVKEKTGETLATVWWLLSEPEVKFNSQRFTNGTQYSVFVDVEGFPDDEVVQHPPSEGRPYDGNFAGLSNKFPVSTWSKQDYCFYEPLNLDDYAMTKKVVAVTLSETEISKREGVSFIRVPIKSVKTIVPADYFASLGYSGPIEDGVYVFSLCDKYGKEVALFHNGRGILSLTLRLPDGDVCFEKDVDDVRLMVLLERTPKVTQILQARMGLV